MIPILRDLNLVSFSCLLAWVILLLPACVYLITTWKYRRNLLFDRLTPDAIDLYYRQFFPISAGKPGCAVSLVETETIEIDSADQMRSETELVIATESAAPQRNERLQEQFKKDFGRLYGRRHYILPLLLLAVVSGVGLLATSRSIQTWLGWTTNLQSFPRIAISAFLGGYAWVLYDQFTRFRTGDFTAHDVYGGVYRFLIVIPLGVSLAALLKDTNGIPIAFLLAAFPTTTLMMFARRLVGQKLGLGESADAGQLELEKLQCVGRSNAERYMDEGITTIAELAWTDPIDLTIKTNREFNFVVDSVSQALLWVYFEDRVKELYPLSLRGAQEVCSLHDDLDSDEPKVKAAAEEILKQAAAIMGMDSQTMLYTLIAVRDDPYAQFLFNIWA